MRSARSSISSGARSCSTTRTTWMTLRGRSCTTPWTSFQVIRDCRSWPDRAEPKTAPPPRCGKAALRKTASEDLCGAQQRLPHAPGDRDADEQPEQRRSDAEPALADPERAVPARRLLAGRGHL